jgi:hypothetical protein
VAVAGDSRGGRPDNGAGEPDLAPGAPVRAERWTGDTSGAPRPLRRGGCGPSAEVARCTGGRPGAAGATGGPGDGDPDDGTPTTGAPTDGGDPDGGDVGVPPGRASGNGRSPLAGAMSTPEPAGVRATCGVPAGGIAASGPGIAPSSGAAAATAPSDASTSEVAPVVSAGVIGPVAGGRPPPSTGACVTAPGISGSVVPSRAAAPSTWDGTSTTGVSVAACSAATTGASARASTGVAASGRASVRCTAGTARTRRPGGVVAVAAVNAVRRTTAVRCATTRSPARGRSGCAGASTTGAAAALGRATPSRCPAGASCITPCVSGWTSGRALRLASREENPPVAVVSVGLGTVRCSGASPIHSRRGGTTRGRCCAASGATRRCHGHRTFTPPR